ncbi:hypothetical protein [Sporosarcina sp. Marseille-Q4943]|uniref:hypothetical protein n=1 Tax=Sporosarcina sp. Marseille-Q4943 TaxID=2942204 RepID=UPI00208DBCE1|nr:hypothetical protein [Sporosarcina sp. Marseille-Q4943]
MKVDIEKLRNIGFPDKLLNGIRQVYEVQYKTVEYENDVFVYSDNYEIVKDQMDREERLNNSMVDEALEETIISAIYLDYDDGRKTYGLITRNKNSLGLEGPKGVLDTRVSYLYIDDSNGKLNRWTATFEDLFLSLSDTCNYPIYYCILEELSLDEKDIVEVLPLFKKHGNYIDISVGDHVGEFELSPAIIVKILKEIMISEQMRFPKGLGKRLVLKSFYYFNKLPRDIWRKANKLICPDGSKGKPNAFELWSKELGLGIPEWK